MDVNSFASQGFLHAPELRQQGEHFRVVLFEFFAIEREEIVARKERLGNHPEVRQVRVAADGERC